MNRSTLGAKGENPVEGPFTVVVDDGAATTTYTISPSQQGSRSYLTVDLDGAVSVTVTDAAGNTGTLALDL